MILNTTVVISLSHSVIIRWSAAAFLISVAFGRLLDLPSTGECRHEFLLHWRKVQGDSNKDAVDAESIVVQRIRPGLPVHGMRAKFDGYLGRSRIRYQVDVELGDAVVPQPEEVQFERMLNLPVAPLRAYTIYSIVAEKLEALAFLGDNTSRMKDLYDLLVLPRELAFDGIALTTAIRATFDKRESSVSEALEILRGNGVPQKKTALWEAFLRKSRLEEQSLLEEAVAMICEFVEPPARAVIADRSFEMFWPAGGPWKESG